MIKTTYKTVIGFYVLISISVYFTTSCTQTSKIKVNAFTALQADSVRVYNMLQLRWGMFLHWSLGTFSGQEWTKGVTSVDSFNTTNIDTDQWCQVAKEAGMGYIIFVAKHHDGFCLWNTKTTHFNVTNSPLKKDVLAELRKSCDKFGIKLCLYFSEADWTWPKMENATMKAAQLKELFSNYGEIPLVWMDVAQWDGGLDHDATEAVIRKYQPNCFIGFNHGLPAGDLQSREMGTFDKLAPVKEAALNKTILDSLVAINKKYVLDLNWEQAAIIENKLISHYNKYLIAECAVPINQLNGKWYWFYNEETKNNAIAAKDVAEMYYKAVHAAVLFSLALGPDKNGRLRAVDVKTLQQVGVIIKK